MEQDSKSAAPSNRGRQLARTIAATIFLGAIGSGIWEVMFRPGLSTVGAIFASASSRFESEIYSTAALDPTTFPGSIFLLLVCSLPLLFAQWLLMSAFVEPAVKKAFIRRDNELLNGVNEKEHRLRILDRRNKFESTLHALVAIALFVLLFIGVTLVNEATMVWRVVNANLDVVAAFQTDHENKLTKASFRQMKSRKDFEHLQSAMNQVAQRNGAKLEWNGL